MLPASGAIPASCVSYAIHRPSGDQSGAEPFSAKSVS